MWTPRLASFLLGRSQQVYCRCSDVAVAFRSATRVCSIGPMLFLLYTAELFDVITECGCTSHAYANDTQVYVSTPAEDRSDAVDRLTSCIIRVRDWMARNRLKLNEDKTQVIWLGTRQQLNKVMVQTLELQNDAVPFSSVVNDFGVLLDSELTMVNQIAALGRSCFFHLRRLRSPDAGCEQAIDWTAATVCWLVLATNCCKCCKSYRMLPLAW